MNTFQRALIGQDTKGWNIQETLRTIIKEDWYNTQEKELAEILLSAFRGRTNMQEDYFKIHCKGLGVRCLK